MNGFHFNSGFFPSVIVVEGFFVNIIKSKIITLVDLRNKSKGNFDLATILSVQKCNMHTVLKADTREKQKRLKEKDY